jgi:hypothetical protein
MNSNGKTDGSNQARHHGSPLSTRSEPDGRTVADFPFLFVKRQVSRPSVMHTCSARCSGAWRTARQSLKRRRKSVFNFDSELQGSLRHAYDDALFVVGHEPQFPITVDQPISGASSVKYGPRMSVGMSAIALPCCVVRDADLAQS